MSSHEPQGALGNSEAMRQVELLLRRVADIDGSLLITGESGVGKDMAARFVHQVSTRAGEPFIAVNCAAIPSELIESQLFGHEKGAFTSAQARHHGHVERAGNGILFLDEVGKLPMPMQAKLLRLIEERTFTRVRGEATIKTGARIICTTNNDLEAAVMEHRFREDLYFRINVIRVAIPRLRDRSDDILPLAQLFMREFLTAMSTASRRKPSRPCSSIPGPAMCGNCATASSKRWRSRWRHRSLSKRSFLPRRRGRARVHL